MAASIICRRTLQNFAKFKWKKPLSRQYTSGAYFVLIPEVPPDTKETNPIMRQDESPKFTELNVNNVVRGCAKMSLEFDSTFDAHVENLSDHSVDKSFDDVFNTIEEILAPMNYAERTVNILMLSDIVKHPKSLGHRVQSQMERSKNDRFVNEKFYNILKELNANRNNLTDYQRRLIDLYLLECRLNGINLVGKKHKIFRECITMITKREYEFAEKCLIQKSQYTLPLGQDDWDIVSQLPRHVRVSMSTDKLNPDKGPWNVNLLGYVYNSFMEMCPRRDLRWNIWKDSHLVSTHITTDIRYHTFTVIEDIRETRDDLAKVLGYDNYAQMSMETKMAGSVETVMAMLDTYKKHFLPMAKDEMQQLQTFANSRGMFTELKQWDIPFYRRLHAESLYKVNKIDKSPYFIYNNVLNTMFRLCEKLFEIKIEDQQTSDVNRWHPDVSVHNVYNTDGTYVSTFYIDPYARWETKIRITSAELGRERCDVMNMTPISYLVLSLNKSTTPGIPSMMSYKEVLELFHQFGSSLQQMLTTITNCELSGQRNIEWDALHVCGYLMGMFAQQPNVIRDMSEHYQSKELLTDNVINNLVDVQKHMAGMDMCHELYYSAFDIECHMGNQTYWLDVHKEMYKIFMPLEINKDDWRWCSDPTLWYGRTHAAAYFSYTWSKMLAANVFESFKEVGFDDEDKLVHVGRRFRDTYLSLGGALDAVTVFRKFKGCNPSLDSLINLYPRKPTESS